MTDQPDKDRRGRYLGLPYDWRRPTVRRTKDELWNPEVRRVFVPKAFGWGYGVNFHELWRRLTGAVRGGR